MASSFWTFSRQALVPRLFRDHSPSLGRGQSGAHRTQLPDELLTSKSWFILLICATTAHFHRVDVDLVETIAVLVTRIFASTVADRFVLVTPHRQTSVDAVLIGIDHRAFDDDCCNDRLDCFLLYIGQHPENDLTIALDQAQDRRLFLFERATATRSFEPSAPPGPTFFWTGCPCARPPHTPRRPRPRLPTSPRGPWQPDLREDATPYRGHHRRSSPTPERSAGSTGSAP